MANHKQAKKRIRQTAKRSLNNRSRMARIRTFTRKFEDAIKGKETNQIGDAFKASMRELHRAVNRGVMHKNTAARKISRLNRRARQTLP